jgi:hypothetical protein
VFIIHPSKDQSRSCFAQFSGARSFPGQQQNLGCLTRPSTPVPTFNSWNARQRHLCSSFCFKGKTNAAALDVIPREWHIWSGRLTPEPAQLPHAPSPAASEGRTIRSLASDGTPVCEQAFCKSQPPSGCLTRRAFSVWKASKPNRVHHNGMNLIKSNLDVSHNHTAKLKQELL